MTRTDRTDFILYEPRIAGDTIVGFAEDTRASNDPAPRLAIASADVRQVAVRERDALRTAGLIAAVGMLIVGTLFALAFGEALVQWYEED